MAEQTAKFTISADARQFTSELAKAQQAAETAFGKIQAVAGPAKAALGFLGVGLSVGAFVSSIKGAIDSLDKLYDVSLRTGASVEALSAFRGALLPDSVAPGIEEIRDEVCFHLRESLLNDASVEVLMDYANTEQGLEDIDVWHQVLKMLPAKSPKRSHVVVHVENLAFKQSL